MVIQSVFDPHFARITYQSFMGNVSPIMVCTCRKYAILSFYRVKLKYLIHCGKMGNVCNDAFLPGRAGYVKARGIFSQVKDLVNFPLAFAVSCSLN